MKRGYFAAVSESLSVTARILAKGVTNKCGKKKVVLESRSMYDTPSFEPLESELQDAHSVHALNHRIPKPRGTVPTVALAFAFPFVLLERPCHSRVIYALLYHLLHLFLLVLEISPALQERPPKARDARWSPR
jgi:hypothetical protein